MAGNLVRITKDLSFQDLQDGQVNYFDAYQKQVSAWIVSPARLLANSKPRNTDNGMALLAIELLFFEAHGQYLTGESSQNKSKRTFCHAFDRFLNFLVQEQMANKNILELDSTLVYKWARCGLFHSAKLSNELLVDAVGFCNQPIIKNPIHGGWLINPWHLIEPLNSYISNYVKELKKDSNSDISKNFNSTFQRLLIEPMEYFCDKT